MTPQEKLIGARIKLFNNNPFFGHMAARLILVEADSWLDTAATDGRHLYYNTTFIDALSDREVIFVFGHELLHAIYDHVGRREHRNADRWNIACDYVTNYDLVEHKIGILPQSVPVLYDPKFGGMSVEQVYEKLETQANSSAETLKSKLLDRHIDFAEMDATTDKPYLSPQIIEEIKAELQDSMIFAASIDPGSTPGDVKRMVNKLTKPELPWKEILRDSMASKVKSDYSWSRPSRRSSGLDVILPGMVMENTIKLFIALDTSGSISNAQITAFLSEIRGLMDMFSDFEITVCSFDTKIYNVCEYDSSSDDIACYEPKGGGGTSSKCVFDYMEQNEIEPELLVVFTDGYVNNWGPADYCDTVWVMHKSKVIAPFGTTIHIQ